MEIWMKEFMEQYGYWGVFILIAIENIFENFSLATAVRSAGISA